MEIIKTRRGSVGNNDIVNGELVKLYAENGTVAGNNFVTLVSGDIINVDFTKKKPPFVVGENDAGGNAAIAAVALSADRVLFIYSRQTEYTSGGVTRTIAAPRLRLASVKNGAISVLSTLDIPPSAGGAIPIIANHVSVQRLSDTRALVFCGITRAVGHSFVIGVTADSIIAGAAIETGRPELLTNQRFAAVSADGIRIEARTFVISDLVIAPETAPQQIIPPILQGVHNAQMIRLRENRLFLLCTIDRWRGSDLGQRNIFYISVVNVSGAGEFTYSAWSPLVNDKTPIEDITGVAISENSAVIAWGYNGVVNATVCRITSNGTLIVGSIAQNRASVYAGRYAMTAVMLASDKVLITASGATGYTGTIATIGGNAISLSAYSQISTGSPMSADAVLQSHDWILCAYSADTAYNAILIPTTQKPPKVRLAEGGEIGGITETACSAAVAGDVWILRTEE